MRRRTFLFLGLALITAGCHHQIPPSLSPHGALVFRANEAAHSIQQIQLVAIALNKLAIPGATDANTKIVVLAIAEGLPVLQKAPEGWKATVSAILERISSRLDDLGKSNLSTYLLLAEAVLNARDLPGPLPTDAEMDAIFQSTITHALADGRAWLAAHP